MAGRGVASRQHHTRTARGLAHKRCHRRGVVARGAAAAAARLCVGQWVRRVVHARQRRPARCRIVRAAMACASAPRPAAHGLCVAAAVCSAVTRGWRQCNAMLGVIRPPRLHSRVGTTHAGGQQASAGGVWRGVTHAVSCACSVAATAGKQGEPRARRLFAPCVGTLQSHWSPQRRRVSGRRDRLSTLFAQRIRTSSIKRTAQKVGETASQNTIHGGKKLTQPMSSPCRIYLALAVFRIRGLLSPLCSPPVDAYAHLATCMACVAL